MFGGIMFGLELLPDDVAKPLRTRADELDKIAENLLKTKLDRDLISADFHYLLATEFRALAELIRPVVTVCGPEGCS
jgi:hypothetical protein